MQADIGDVPWPNSILTTFSALLFPAIYQKRKIVNSHIQRAAIVDPGVQRVTGLWCRVFLGLTQQRLDVDCLMLTDGMWMWMWMGAMLGSNAEVGYVVLANENCWWNPAATRFSLEVYGIWGISNGGSAR